MSGPRRPARTRHLAWAPRAPASRVALALLCTLSFAACVPSLSPRDPDFERELERAERAMGRGQYDAAARRFQDAASLASRPIDQDEALYRAAVALQKQKKWGEARDTLLPVAEADPPRVRSARATLEIARTYGDEGDAANETLWLERVVTVFPDSGLGVGALRRLRRLARARDGEAGELRLVNRLEPPLRDSSLGDDVVAVQADLLFAMGKDAEAEARLEHLVAAYPFPKGHRWDNALMTLAELDERRGDLRAALAHLEALLAVHESSGPPGSSTLPTAPKASLKVGELYERLSEIDKARAAYRRAYEDFDYASTRDDALQAWAALELKAGRVGEACRLVERLLAEFDVGHPRRLAERLKAEHCLQTP